MPRIHDLLDLPQAVRKGDFVQSLASGIDQPEATVRTYAITPDIVATFRHALEIVDSALRDQRSQAAYLHGSFGSGKSHFMAILNLMLANHEAPWKRGEFHELREHYDWIGAKKILQIPMHMIGSTSIEDRVFDTYVRWTQTHHPDAPFPPLFADLELFENASQLRQDLGDERFFSRLNEGAAVDSKWGALAEEAVWDGDRFEATLAITDDKARGKLFSALVKTHFPAFAREKSRFIGLDSGLQVIAEHAQQLGYDAVVLYLDELILWLASNASDLSLIERETQKLVKLKEGQHDIRAIPIISLIARQRDLAQLVGERARGDERAALEDNLKHNQGRFETVMLADSNLPAIVQHRVVRPKDDASRQVLEDGFAGAWRGAGQARPTLIGSLGGEEAFKQVFPFSPALIEALVALSDCLQRERTAIRILMELLVQHLPGLEVGPIVPVGDAFDVIAGGEEPFDQVMKARFARARHLYEDNFLPMIQADHGMDSPEKCQRLRKGQRIGQGHHASLGCSGCPQTGCRTDNRLAKTLLMAALVPETPTFKGLTVKRLVHLNHGTIATPIPGAEVNVAAANLRRWAAQIGPLRIGDQQDPEITLHLEGVDLKPIMDSARDFDTIGARKQALRKVLFEDLDLPTDAATVEHTEIYLGTRRKGTVRFGNTREMSDGQLGCPTGSEWYVPVDYPFDTAGFTPEDDIRRIEDYRNAHGDQADPTVVWLATFFSHTMEQTLGDFVVLGHILEGDTQRYLGHLRVEDQAQARSDLRSLRDQKRDQLGRALKVVYGLVQPGAEAAALDSSRAVEEHFVTMDPSLRISALLAGTLAQGLTQIVGRVMEHRYPHHPKFGATVTVGKLDRVRVLVERLLETPDHRMAITAADKKDLRNFGDPLGITQTAEAHVLLNDTPLKNIEQQRQRAGVDTPTVEDVQGYADPSGNLGLQSDTADLLVWLYGLWSGRSMVHAGKPVETFKLGQLPGDAELIRPELPTEQEWVDALQRAARLLGITFANRHLSARNLAGYCSRVQDKVDTLSGAADLPSQLERRLRDWGEPSSADRLVTARSAASLLTQVKAHDGAALVREVAAFKAATSEAAVARSLSHASPVTRALQAEARWIVFSSVRKLLSDPTKANQAQLLLDDLARALATDEINLDFAKTLEELTRRAGELIKEPEPKDWKLWHAASSQVEGEGGWADAMKALGEELEGRVGDQQPGGDLRLEVTARILRRDEVDE